MKKVCEELICFFEEEEGWDREALISDYCEIILKEAGTTFSADELCISDGEGEIMVLSDFVDRFFDKIIVGVCNVIKTA